MAKNLRNQEPDALLRENAGKTAIIDMSTRWGSTYQMVKRLIELKEHIIPMGRLSNDYKLNDFDWSEAERLERILAIPYKATLQLQKEQLTPGSCFMAWRRVIENLR